MPELLPGDWKEGDLLPQPLAKTLTTTTIVAVTKPARTETAASSSRQPPPPKKEGDAPEEPPPPPDKNSPPAGGGSGDKRGDKRGKGHGGDGGGDDDPSSDSSESSYGSALSGKSTRSTAKLIRKVMRKDRIKEATEVKVPNLPNPNQFRAWKHTVYQNANAASGRSDDDTLAWIRECEKADAKIEDFQKCNRRFATLDRKLASALSKTATGELGRLLTQASEDALSEDRSIRGRELLFIILRYYATGKTAEVMFSLNDLQMVKAKQDQLESFHNTWIMVLKALPKRPDDEILEFLYYQQIKGMKVLAEDIFHYNRQETGDKDRNYDYLTRAVERQLRLGRQEKMRAALSRGLVGDASTPPKTPALPGTPENKGGGKDKKGGRGRDRSRANSEPPPGKAVREGKGRACHFYKKGKCNNGQSCPFLHEDGDAAAAARPAKTELCSFFAKGNCRYGDACTKSHDKSRSRSPKGGGKGKPKEKAKAKAKAKGKTPGMVARPGPPPLTRGVALAARPPSPPRGRSPAQPRPRTATPPRARGVAAVATCGKGRGGKKIVTGRGILRAQDAAPKKQHVTFNLEPQYYKVPGRRCAGYYNPTTEMGSFRPAAPAATAAAVAVPTDSKESPDRWWLVDTGCPYDLTSLSNPANVHPPIAGEGINLNTANGDANCEVQIPIQVGLPTETGIVPEDMFPYGMDNETPDVFGVGYRVEERDFALFWSKKHGCTLYLPGGIIKPPVAKKGSAIKLKTVQHVPYFVDTGQCAYNEDGAVYGHPGADEGSAPVAAPGKPKSSGSSATAETPESSAAAEAPGPSAAAETSTDDEMPDLRDASTDGDSSEEADQHLLDHAVFDPNCHVCIAAKKTRNSIGIKRIEPTSHQQAHHQRTSETSAPATSFTSVRSVTTSTHGVATTERMITSTREPPPASCYMTTPRTSATCTQKRPSRRPTWWKPSRNGVVKMTLSRTYTLMVLLNSWPPRAAWAGASQCQRPGTPDPTGWRSAKCVESRKALAPTLYNQDCRSRNGRPMHQRRGAWEGICVPVKATAWMHTIGAIRSLSQDLGYLLAQPSTSSHNQTLRRTGASSNRNEYLGCSSDTTYYLEECLPVTTT